MLIRCLKKSVNLPVQIRSVSSIYGLLSLVACGMQIQTAQGANLTVTVDTSSLVGRTGGPFSVGFYLNDGSKLGDGNNTVTLTGFDFGGGTALGNITQLGTASGSLSSGIILTDSLLITGFTQQFNPGSHLAFTISTTTNIDSAGVPDMFVMVILDGNAKPLPTQTGQTLFPVLAAMTLNSAAPGLQTYGLVSALLATATPLGSMAQIASAGGWNTTFALVNTGQTPAAAQLNFYSDPTGTPLPFPLTFPQIPLNSLTSASFDRMINPNSVFMVNTSGSVSQAPTIGWGELLASSSAVSGFGVFNFPQLNWNAVVPLETRNANSYILPFDNTGSLTTGVAVANVAAEAANIPVIIRSDTGAQIGTATVALKANGHAFFMLNQQYPVATDQNALVTINMRDDTGALLQATVTSVAAFGHTSFMLPDVYPMTVGERGTVEFVPPTGGRISVIGVRATSDGTLTTIPILAK